jgi:hypothetical protein
MNIQDTLNIFKTIIVGIKNNKCYLILLINSIANYVTFLNMYLLKFESC